MTGERLKACPWCGGKAETTPEGIWTACTECGCVTDPTDWNTRSLPAALDTVIAAVEARVPRNHLDHAETVQCLALLRALRAEHSAGEGEDGL